LEYIAFISVLANAGLLLVSKEFLTFVLGHGTDKWMPALTAFRILCIYGMCRCLLEPVGNVILAIGRTRELLITQIIVAVFELGLLYPSLKYFGIEGVAVVVTVAYVTAYPLFCSKPIGSLTMEANVSRSAH
jgi:O-antigen/teichoic acid export membrane protein